MKTRTSIYHRTFAFAYVLLVAVIFCGCETNIPREPIKDTYNGSNIQVMTIDSCEYLFANLDIRSLTHKGNCKFCAERSKK
jgi:hypothetical protein